MVVQVHEESDHGWVAFETEFDTQGSRRPRQSRRKSSSTSHPKRSSSSDSWIERPPSSNSSWTPIPAPTQHRMSSSRSVGGHHHRPSSPTLLATAPPLNRSTKSLVNSTILDGSHRYEPALPKRQNDSARTMSLSSSSSGRESESDREKKQREQKQATRGRSKSRRDPPPPIKEITTVRARSQSRPRETSRGRSTSRSRSMSRNRTRSESLTRVTGPGAQAPRSPTSKRNKKPPTTRRTQEALRGRGDGQRTRSSSIGPGVRSRNSAVVADDRSVGTMDLNIGRNVAFQRQDSTVSNRSSSSKRPALMEKLFGDHAPKKISRSVLTQNVRPRVLLAATVYHNTATNLWIATINTNQRGVAKNPSLANKYLKAFSFPTEQEARESAIANAPPKMIPFKSAPNCQICEGKFVVFRRAGHCRNCGICICNSCSTSWPAKMIPDTYNLKKEASVKICMTCNALSHAFKKALYKGDYEEVIALYGTGNVNLRNPLSPSHKKEETMYPIHCAVEGGNINIVRWLMDDHFVPLKASRCGGKKSNRRDNLIPTSKGRTVLSIATERLQVDIMRYLIVDHNVSVHELSDLKLCLRALEATLMCLPRAADNRVKRDDAPIATRWDKATFDDMSVPSSLGESERFMDDGGTIGSKSHRTKGGSDCILCYENKINCVATPCGHQVCCLACSKNLSACPVCNNRGEFIKIFRP